MSTVEGGGNVVTDGLVLYLDAANHRSYVSGSTDWNDLSRGRNAGTLLPAVGGPTFSSANGGSIVFDGVDDYVNLGNNSTLSPPNITVSTWFKINGQNASNNNQGIIRNRTFGYGIFIKSDLSYLTYVYNSNLVTDISRFDSNPGSLNLNTFYNLYFTFGNSLLKTYLNGILINTSASAVSNIIYYPGSGNNVGLGRDANFNDNYLNGNIAQISIYNRALSESEISQNFNATRARFGI